MDKAKRRRWLFIIFFLFVGYYGFITIANRVKKNEENKPYVNNNYPQQIYPVKFRKTATRIHFNENLLVTHRKVAGFKQLMFSAKNDGAWNDLKPITVPAEFEECNCYNPIITYEGVFFLSDCNEEGSNQVYLMPVWNSKFDEPIKIDAEVPKGLQIVDYADPTREGPYFLLLAGEKGTYLYNKGYDGWERNIFKSESGFDRVAYDGTVKDLFHGSYLFFSNGIDIHYSKRGKTYWTYPKKIKLPTNNVVRYPVVVDFTPTKDDYGHLVYASNQDSLGFELNQYYLPEEIDRAISAIE